MCADVDEAVHAIIQLRFKLFFVDFVGAGRWFEVADQ